MGGPERRWWRPDKPADGQEDIYFVGCHGDLAATSLFSHRTSSLIGRFLPSAIVGVAWTGDAPDTLAGEGSKVGQIGPQTV